MKLVGFSGKKQSGKNTAYNFMCGLAMAQCAVVRGNVEVVNKGMWAGKLHVDDIFGEDNTEGIFDIEGNQDPQFKAFVHETIYPFVRNYSFGDALKQKVCIDLLGLNHDQCYGTNEQKDQPTHLLWENMSGIVSPKDADGILSSMYGAGEDPERLRSLLPVVIHEDGPMTAREVMQYVGTDIFRKMYEPVWTANLIKEAEAYGSKISVVTDVRFPNEVKAIQDAGGKVIRLSRDVCEDNHYSDNALNPDVYDWDNFDSVIDNSEMDINRTCGAIHEVILDWGFLD